MWNFKKVKDYFKSFNFWIYLILILCILGLFRNMVFLTNFRFLNNNLSHIFWAMISLYAAQILFILLKHWAVWVVSGIQVIFCIWIYPDFSITPFSAVLDFLFFDRLKENSFAWAHFINFMFVSLGFSVEIIKTYLLYLFFPRKTKPKLQGKETL